MEINRVSLLSMLNLTRPALATQDYIPSLSHFMFDGDSVIAYNDISAISIRCRYELEGCLPGDLLIKTLNSLTSEMVMLTRHEGYTLVTAGKSKIKLPTLQSSDFPFDFTMKTKSLGEFTVSKPMLEGLQKCLIGVGTDPTHPAQMGITLDPMYSDTEAALYSTDNVTISKFVFHTDMELPADMQIILPTFFCNQLLALSKAISDDVVIEIHPGALLADFGGEAQLFTKTLVDLEPMAFAEIISKYANTDRLKALDIPDPFDQSFERALLIQSAELDKSTGVSVQNGKLFLTSKSKHGEVSDEMKYAGSDIEFSIDPALVKRISPICSKMVMLPKVLVFTNDELDYVHLIAHVV